MNKLFTGQRLDQTGLYFYNARYYDATIGRFISPDTVVPKWMNPQTLNRYSYCYNNPLVYIDPTGHWGWSSIKKGFKKVAKAVTKVAKAAVDTVVDAGKAVVDAGKAVVNSTAGKIALGVVGTIAIGAAAVVAAPVVVPALAAAGSAALSGAAAAGSAVAAGATAAGSAIAAGAAAAGSAIVAGASAAAGSSIVTGAAMGAAIGAAGQVGGTMAANILQGNSLFQGLSWTGVGQAAIIGGLTGGFAGAIGLTSSLTLGNLGKGILVSEVNGFANYGTDIVQGQTEFTAVQSTVVGAAGLTSGFYSQVGAGGISQAGSGFLRTSVPTATNILTNSSSTALTELGSASSSAPMNDLDDG